MIEIRQTRAVCDSLIRSLIGDQLRRWHMGLLIGMVTNLLANILVSTSIQAQVAYTELSTRSETTKTTSSEIQDRLAKKQVVSLSVKDSTVGYVIRVLARQANLRLSYDIGDSAFEKTITVRITNAEITRAFADALKGTGLIATITSDRETVVVRRNDTIQRGTDRITDSVTTGSIVGRVLDSLKRTGVAGATITILGTKLSTTTRENGRFTFPSVGTGTQSLSVRLLGYESRVIPVIVSADQSTNVTVTLKQTSTTLSEVVTTATGRQRRVEVGNDIAVIKADSIMRSAPITSVSELLSVARVPGVEVTPSSGTPGAPSRIRIRGVTSMNSNNDPIVIVDGVRIYAPTSTDALKSQTAARFDLNANNSGTYSGDANPSPLDAIDPASIETIEIIRGPSASAVYGSDAGNGVIVITTKRGTPGKVVWDVATNRSWGVLPNRGMTGQLFRAGTSAWGEDFIDCGAGDWVTGLCTLDSVLVLRNAKDSRNDNEGTATDEGVTASVRGGSPQITYALTASLSRQTGAARILPIYRVLLAELNNPAPNWAVRPNTFDRNNLTASVSLVPHPSIDLNFTIQGMQTHKREANRMTAIRELDFNDFEPPGIDDAIALARDPKFRGNFVRGLNEANSMRGILSFSGSWKIANSLIPRLTGGIDQSSDPERKVDGVFSCDGGGKGCTIPRYSIYGANRNTSVTTVKLQSSLPDPLGRWSRWLSVRPSLGADLTRSMQTTVSYSAFPRDLGSVDINLADTITLTGLDNNSATGGFYASLNIGLLQRLYTEVAFRRDEGSTFRINKNLSRPTFPKISQSYLVSDEPFFPKSNLLKTLRLRGAIGYSANQPTIREVEGGFFQTSVELFPGQTENIVLQNQLANFGLRPERIFESEYGVDVGLLDERIFLTVTMAEKRTHDAHLLYQGAPSIGSVAGGNRFKRNVGDVLNRSVEVGLETQLMDRPMFGWNLNISFSSLMNRLKKLSSDGRIVGASDPNRLRVGYPLDGVWVPMILSASDADSNGVITANEVVKSDSLFYAGWGHPRYSLSYNNVISLLGGRVRITANLSQDVGVTQTSSGTTSCSVLPYCTIDEQLQRYIKNSTSLDMPYLPSTVSILQFQAAGITVTLPASLMRRLKVSSGSTSLLASNLKLWTNYQGRDPRVNSSPVGERLTDNGATTPLPRKYQLAVRLTF